VYSTGMYGALNWTGRLTLELRNGRDWAAGEAEVTLSRDTVDLCVHGRQLAVMDRDRLREWLTQAEPEPYAVDDLVWSVQLGATCLAAGTAFFTVTADSLGNLVAVV
jgi:hypothetical protein